MSPLGNYSSVFMLLLLWFLPLPSLAWLNSPAWVFARQLSLIYLLDPCAYMLPWVWPGSSHCLWLLRRVPCVQTLWYLFSGSAVPGPESSVERQQVFPSILSTCYTLQDTVVYS